MHNFSQNIGEPINTFILPFVFIDKVKEAVESIWKRHNPQEHRLILFDQTGEEFIDRMWLEENCHFYIKAYRNLGPAVAFNLGIEMARTEYVTIISDDARLISSLWFNQAVEKIKKEEKRQAFIESYNPLIVSANSIHPQDVKEGEFYDPTYDYTSEVYINLERMYGKIAPGFGLACAMGRKSAWIKSGLFDESKYIYWIDGVFADSAKKNGVTCLYQGVVFHYGDASHKGRLVEENKYSDAGIIGRQKANI